MKKVELLYNSMTYDYGHREALHLTARIGRWERKWGVSCIAAGCIEAVHGHAMEILENKFWRFIGAK